MRRLSIPPFPAFTNNFLWKTEPVPHFEAGYKIVEEASTCEFAEEIWHLDQYLEHIHALIASAFTNTEPSVFEAG